MVLIVGDVNCVPGIAWLAFSGHTVVSTDKENHVTCIEISEPDWTLNTLSNWDIQGW